MKLSSLPENQIVGIIMVCFNASFREGISFHHVSLHVLTSNTRLSLRISQLLILQNILQTYFCCYNGEACFHTSASKLKKEKKKRASSSWEILVYTEKNPVFAYLS